MRALPIPAHHFGQHPFLAVAVHAPVKRAYIDQFMAEMKEKEYNMTRAAHNLPPHLKNKAMPKHATPL